MGAFIDLTGSRIGKLTVTGNREKRKNTYFWECKCDCGNSKYIGANNLKHGEQSTQSCGCLHKEILYRRLNGEVLKEIEKCVGKPIKPFGLAAANRLFGTYKRQSGYSNRTFELSFGQFLFITSLNCHYCGKEPFQVTRYNEYRSKEQRKPTYNGEYIYSGIDRKNSSLGYILENCLPCCGHCNQAKNDLTYDQFLGLIKSIYSNLVVK